MTDVHNPIYMYAEIWWCLGWGAPGNVTQTQRPSTWTGHTYVKDSSGNTIAQGAHLEESSEIFKFAIVDIHILISLTMS